MTKMKRRAERDFAECIFGDIKYSRGKVEKNDANVVIRTRFTCPQKGCKGSGKYENGRFILIQNHYGHSPDPMAEARYIADQQLYERTISTFDDIDAVYADFILLHADVAQQWNAVKKKRTMSIWRKSANLPRLDHSFAEFHRQLYTEKWSSLRKCCMDSIDVNLFGDEGVSFSHPELIRRLSSSDMLIINTTTSPRLSLLPIDQIVTVFAVEPPGGNLRRKKRHIYPCIWICLRRKTPQSFQKIREKLDLYFAGVQTIWSNWDSELHESLEGYPNVQGTFYSYCMAIQRKCCNLGINLEDEQRMDVIRKLTLLPFLPSGSIREYFRRIVDELPPNNLFQRLIEYVDDVWIKSIGAEKMSLYGNITALADCQRLYDLVVRSEFIKQEPTIYDFFKFLIKTNRQNLAEMEKEKSSNYYLKVDPSFDAVSVKDIWKNLKKGRYDVVRAFEKLFNNHELKRYIIDIFDFPQPLPADFNEQPRE